MESCFIENKYRHIYDSLCARAVGRVVLGYTEKHHILPKSLGGSNKKENLVQLTGREHYIAHLCLVRCTEGQAKYKMLCAARYLGLNRHTIFKMNARLFAHIREEHARQQKGYRFL